MTYTELYTAIDACISPAIDTIYYTTLPAEVSYPHCLVVIISDTPTHTNDTPATGSMSRARLQIECRAISQVQAITDMDTVDALLTAKSETDTNGFYARSIATPRPLIYDTDQRVYRSIREYYIIYK